MMFFVPEGLLKIAQPFMAGKMDKLSIAPSPVGTAQFLPTSSVVPTGLDKRHHRTKPSDESLGYSRTSLRDSNHRNSNRRNQAGRSSIGACHTGGSQSSLNCAAGRAAFHGPSINTYRLQLITFCRKVRIRSHGTAAGSVKTGCGWVPAGCRVR